MATAANSLNISQAGQVRFDGVSVFSGDTLTQYDVLVGGASNAIVSVGPGSSGQVLQSGGSLANPAYSTATYPGTAGTSGNVLTSNGTNWLSSAAPGSGLTSVDVTWTNVNLKAGSPQTIVAAQGAGTIIVCVNCILKFVYGGSNAFTNSSQTALNYGTAFGTNKILVFESNTSFWEATANQYAMLIPATNAYTGTGASIENTAVSMNIASATAFTGNAAGNNTVQVKLLYYVTTV